LSLGKEHVHPFVSDTLERIGPKEKERGRAIPQTNGVSPSFFTIVRSVP